MNLAKARWTHVLRGCTDFVPIYASENFDPSNLFRAAHLPQIGVTGDVDLVLSVAVIGELDKSVRLLWAAHERIVPV